ncbi:MAG: type II toxin-antitoxin system RelE/ParE family toxin [Psychroserpens sp.]|nr:type II toxin-antitoxin system RelE/ParE family toxin [Psychroserpens sp.]
MAKRTIKWTRTADIQYVGILEYWVKRNKSSTYSKKLIKIVAKRTEQLAETPFICKKAEFKDTHVASLGNFSIFYKVTDKEILITAFWDNRQDPKKLLQILKDKK